MLWHSWWYDGTGTALLRGSVGGRMATLATGLVGSLYDFSDAMAHVCDVSTFVMVVVVLVLVLHCLADRFEGAWRL
jgi:hypothetical protein